jgi:hypothetical protein
MSPPALGAIRYETHDRMYKPYIVNIMKNRLLAKSPQPNPTFSLKLSFSLIFSVCILAKSLFIDSFI